METQQGNSAPNQEGKRALCDFCDEEFLYSNLRVCYGCDNVFCLNCAPPVRFAILQCCNYHGFVLWFCSEECKGEYTEEDVRSMNILEKTCEDSF